MLKVVYKLSFGISILAFFLLLLFRLQLIGYYDNSVGSFEYNILYGIQKIMSGQSLYTNPEIPPFAIIQKTPLYYYLVAHVGKIIGLNATDVMPLLRLNRTIALLLNVGTLAVFYSILRSQLSVKKYAALAICSMLFFVFMEQYFTKMDALYILFFTLIIRILLQHTDGLQSKNAVHLGILSALMILSKQTGIFLIIFIFARMVAQKNRLTLVTISGFTGLCCLLLFFFLGEIDFILFYKNAFLGLENGMQISYLKNVLASEFHMPILIMGLLIPYLCWEKRNNIGYLLAFAILFFLVIGIASLLKVGADLNYLTEFKMVLLLGICYLCFSSNSKFIYLLSIGCLLLFSILTIGAKTSEIIIKMQIKDYDNQPEEYLLEKQIAKKIIQEFLLQEGSYYYLPSRSFLNIFLFDKVVFPIENVNLEVFRVENSELNFRSIQPQLNQGLIEYVILKEDTKISEIRCFDTPLEQFEYFKKMEMYSIYRLIRK